MADTFVFAAHVPLTAAAFEEALAASTSLESGNDLEQVFAGRWDAEPPVYEAFGGNVLALIQQRLLSRGPLLVHQRNALSIYATAVGFHRSWFGDWLALLASVAPMAAGTGWAVFCAETGGHLYPEGVLSVLQVDGGRLRCLPGPVNAALRSLRTLEKRYFASLEKGSVPVDERIVPVASNALSLRVALSQIASLASLERHTATSAHVLRQLKPAIDTLAKSKTTNDALPLLRDLLRHQSPPVVFVTAWTLARLASRSKDPATLDTLAGYLESITDADDDRLDTFFDGRGNVERLQDRACDAFAKNPQWLAQHLDRSFAAKRHPALAIGAVPPGDEKLQQLAIRVADKHEAFDGWFNYDHLLMRLLPSGAERVGPQVTDRLLEGRLRMLLTSILTVQLEVAVRSGNDPISWSPFRFSDVVIGNDNPVTAVCDNLRRVEQPQRFAEEIRSLFASVVAVVREKPVLYVSHVYRQQQPPYVSFLKAPPAELEEALTPTRLQFEDIFISDEQARSWIAELTAYRANEETAKDVLRRLRTSSVLKWRGGIDHAIYEMDRCLDTGNPPAVVVVELLLKSYVLYAGDTYAAEVTTALLALRSKLQPDAEPLLERLLPVADRIGPEDAYRICLEGALSCRALSRPATALLLQLFEALLARWPSDERLLSAYLMVCATAAQSSRARPILLRNASGMRATGDSCVRLWAAKVLADTGDAGGIFDEREFQGLLRHHIQ